jgi:hypothetical protein
MVDFAEEAPRQIVSGIAGYFEDPSVTHWPNYDVCHQSRATHYLRARIQRHAVCRLNSRRRVLTS